MIGSPRMIGLKMRSEYCRIEDRIGFNGHRDGTTASIELTKASKRSMLSTAVGMDGRSITKGGDDGATAGGNCRHCCCDLSPAHRSRRPSVGSLCCSSSLW